MLEKLCPAVLAAHIKFDAIINEKYHQSREIETFHSADTEQQVLFSFQSVR